MKEIILNRGFVAIISDEDFERVNQYKWTVRKCGNNFYGQRSCKLSNGLWGLMLLHQFIMNGKGIDHIDGDGLNNQRTNLRFCTQLQNLMNMKSNKNTTSKYKGVSWCSDRKRWVSHITINKKVKHLGRFKDENDAAIKYNQAAKINFGEYARLNIIE